VNEEDPERDRATRCRRLVPPCYVPEGDSGRDLGKKKRARRGGRKVV